MKESESGFRLHCGARDPKSCDEDCEWSSRQKSVLTIHRACKRCAPLVVPNASRSVDCGGINLTPAQQLLLTVRSRNEKITNKFGLEQLYLFNNHEYRTARSSDVPQRPLVIQLRWF